MRMTSTASDRLSNERGAAAVFVAITLVLLFGFGAFSIDLGNLWRERRHVIRATDAAALAAAQGYALGENGCGTIDDEYAEANDSRAVVQSCEATGISSTSGVVTVEANTPVNFAFAGVLGADDRTVSATTSAEYNSPTSTSGLRPYGLCEKVPQLAWIGSGDIPTTPSTFTFEHGTGGACGEAAGNWGALEMADDGSGQGECFDNNSFGDCVRNGTELPVSIDEQIGGAPGSNLCNSRQVKEGMEYLIDTGAVIGLPVYDEVDEGGGETADFTISAFVGVVITDFESSGSTCSITLEFRRLVTEGTWDPGEAGPLTGVFSVRICDVDSGDGECGA